MTILPKVKLKVVPQIPGMTGSPGPPGPPGVDGTNGADPTKVAKAGDTMHGPLAINPPANSLSAGYSITQSGAGTAPPFGPFILGNFAYNGIHVTNDNVDSPGGVVVALAVQADISGASATGAGHGAATFTANVNGAVPPDGSLGGITAMTGLSQSLYPLGGTGVTGLTAKGSIYGFNVYAIAYGPSLPDWPGATNLFNVTGGEINIALKAGASAYYKSGLQIAQLPDDAVQGAAFDIGYSLSNMAGAVGWKVGLGFSNANGGHPVSPTGTLIGTIGGSTVANGVDFSSYTITGSAFKSTGYSITGKGTPNFTGAGHWSHGGTAVPADSAGTFYSTITQTDRFFVGTDTGSDLFRIFSAGAVANVFTIDGATGAVGLPVGATSLTPTAGDSSTKIATTAFVAGAAGGAWTTTTPAVSATTPGTMVASAAAHHRIEGKKLFYSVVVTITTAGTGSGRLRVTLPAAVVGAALSSGEAATGVACAAIAASGGSILEINKYDGSTIIADGRFVVASGVMELA